MRKVIYLILSLMLIAMLVFVVSLPVKSQINTVVVEPTAVNTSTESGYVNAVDNRFFDVDEKYWGFSYIEVLCTKGIVSGYTDDSFRPNDNITNGEFISMVTRALGEDITETQGKWFQKFYDKAFEIGLIDKTEPDDMVAVFPYDNITREQAARVSYHALQYTEAFIYEYKLRGAVKAKVADYDDISEFYLDGVNGAYIGGIIVGSNGEFRPKNSLTRAEACVIINKLIDKSKRPVFETDQYITLRLEGLCSREQGYPLAEYVYLDKKYQDYVKIVEIMQKENETIHDGYFIDVYNNTGSDFKDNFVISGSLGTDFNVYAAYDHEYVTTIYYSIDMYEKHNILNYEKYTFEITDSLGNDYRKKLGTLTEICKYLFGKQYQFVLDKFELAHHKEKPPTGTIYDITFELNGRDVCISLYSDGVVLRTTLTKEGYTSIPYITPTNTCGSALKDLTYDDNVNILCVFTLNKLIQEHRQDVVIVDVRTEGEYQNGHIEGAINIPVDTLQENISILEDYKDKYVIVYCQSGVRSSQALELLKENEFIHILHYAEGYSNYRE